MRTAYIRALVAALIIGSMLTATSRTQAAESSNRSRVTAKVRVPTKRTGPKYHKGNYNPNKGRSDIRRSK
jgi:hypothetical protein